MSASTVMKYNQIVMSLSGIYPKSFSAPSLNLLRFISPYFVTINLVICDILSAKYAIQETRLSLILQACILLIGGSISLSAYHNMRWKMNSAAQVNAKLQEIADQASAEKSLAPIYLTVEQRCRRFTMQMSSFAVFELASIVMALFISFYHIHVGNLDTSTYYLPLHYATPFTIDSVFKWDLFWAIQLLGCVAYLAGTVVVITYFVCCCFYVEALCDHFDLLIETIDDELHPKRRDSNQVDIRSGSSNVRKIFSDAIDHHNKIYE